MTKIQLLQWVADTIPQDACTQCENTAIAMLSIEIPDTPEAIFAFVGLHYGQILWMGACEEGATIYEESN